MKYLHHHHYFLLAYNRSDFDGSVNNVFALMFISWLPLLLVEFFVNNNMYLYGKIFVNAPRWYISFFTMIYPFVTQEAKSKFVVTHPARVTETLFK